MARFCIAYENIAVTKPLHLNIVKVGAYFGIAVSLHSYFAVIFISDNKYCYLLLSY